MKWRKLGHIFDPTQFSLPGSCTEFAQSPQTLVFDDFVRIYFSTRARDANGKYLSHIAFVDMDKNLRDIRRIADRTPIPLGGLGCFDEHGIFPINVVRHEKSILAYTSGWSRRVSVSVETGIGLAISNDNGETFRKLGTGPVMTASLHEPFLVVDGFVRIIDERFHMWYIRGTGWQQFSPNDAPDRIYKIGHATSADGVDWLKDKGLQQPIADRLGEQESQALPCVIEIDGIYHMFFCYRQSFDFRRNSDRAYRIGHAQSEDLVTWVRDDDAIPLPTAMSGWDSDMQCYPHVFECDENVYLLYNGNEFGRYGFGLAVLER